ncbi:unnamed protein product [Camellia sinensis]
MESKFASSSSIVFIILVFFFLCSTQTTISLQTNIIFNATVAQDGSGNYRRINDAIVAAPMHISVTNRYYIRVKPGVYSEYVVVGEDKTNIALIGDDAATTKITGNRSNATGFGTTQSATMTVDGEGFIGQSLTIENSAPINSGQAVALNNNADHSAFYKCIFMGYQDTLLANKNSQFYKNCEISGTVDFIFGSASAVFQDCGIYVRRLSPPNVITANGGKHDPTSSNFGFSFQNCTINVAPELRSRKKEVKAFLGRPWKNYATVVFMESYLDEIVLPEGWTWCCNNTIMMFAEYNNRGPGADTSRRAKLSGYNVFKSATEATPFTVSKLIDGDSWIPQTGIPYRGGLNRIGYLEAKQIYGIILKLTPESRNIFGRVFGSQSCNLMRILEVSSGDSVSQAIEFYSNFVRDVYMEKDKTSGTVLPNLRDIIENPPSLNVSVGSEVLDTMNIDWDIGTVEETEDTGNGLGPYEIVNANEFLQNSPLNDDGVESDKTLLNKKEDVVVPEILDDLFDWFPDRLVSTLEEKKRHEVKLKEGLKDLSAKCMELQNSSTSLWPKQE